MTADEQRETITLLAAESDEGKIAVFLDAALASAWSVGYRRGRADESRDAPDLIAVLTAEVTAH